MLTGTDVFHVIALRLQDVITAALSTPVESAGVTPGAIAWDKCDCGMLRLSVQRTFFYESFPSELGAVINGCEVAQFAADIVIQIIRCAPSPGEQGEPPSTAALAASAQQVSIDAYEAMTAVLCELQDMASADEIDGYLVRSSTSQGPSGGCVGSQFTATVGVPR